MRPAAHLNQHKAPTRSTMHAAVVALACLWCAATVGVGVGAQDAPDYPTFAAAMKDNNNNLGEMYVLLNSPILVNASAFLNDPNNNAILLGLTNSELDAAFSEFTDYKLLLSDGLKARALFQYVVIPQTPGTKNAVLDLTDGISLNTSLTNSPQYAEANAQTLSTLTFKDEGQGKWYIGGTPPGAQIDISRSFSCGAGRLYILDSGVPAPPSKVISTPQSVDRILSVTEALQASNLPKSLSTYAELVMADTTIKDMFSDPDLTITVFAPSNQAWSDYFKANLINITDFKGSKEAHDVLLGCMAVQRPYMISQFPAGLTQVSDSLNRTMRLQAPAGPLQDNSTQVKLVSKVSSVSVLPAPARNLRGGKSIIHGVDGVILPDAATAVELVSGTGNATSDYPTFAAALQDPKNNLTTMYFWTSLPTLINASAMLNDPTNNAIMLGVTNADFDFALAEFADSQILVANPVNAKALLLYAVIPQAPGTRNAVFDLTDGISLNTSLTLSPDYAQTNTQTLSTITFRDEGQGMWYLGGTPPGARLDTSKSLTCGAGRLYFVDGFLGPPSKVIATNQSVDTLLSVTEALQPGNFPKDLAMFAELALADADIKSMFSNGNIAITIFAPSNQAWSDYFTSHNTTLAAFKGTKPAQRILLGCMATQRPFMISQFPTGLTPVTDALNRSFSLASGGQPSDDNPQARLVVDTGSVSVLPAPARNMRGGKSIIHGIDGVLILDPVVANATTGGNSTTPPNTTTDKGSAADSTSGSGFGKERIGLIVGVVVGGTAAAALVALTVICVVLRRAAPTQQTYTISKDTMSKYTHMDIPGVQQGIFTRLVAHEFQWTEYTAIPGKTISVEAGITDTQLDQMLTGEGEGGGGAEGEGQCPVVALTKQEVKEQLILLKDGNIGKGATAMVFKCLWPSRFGPDALLAAKVLREGSDAPQQHLQSFTYEASVLSSLLHPNVVRLYGYCLEPPTVVLILELLPTSLKRMLYDTEPSATHPSTASHTHSAQQSRRSHMPTSSSVSTQLPTDGTGRATHGHQSTMHPSSQHHEISIYAPSERSNTHTSGSEQQLAAQESQPRRSPSTVISDAEVTLTMQPSKAAVRKLTVREVLTISADIAAGLAFMHDRAGVEIQPVSPFQEPIVGPTTITKVVHRDLKPANILVNSRGHAKISDFGLARQHHQTTIATAHLGAGTLPYMAPELLVHAAAGGYVPVTATNRVDIYSLAMIIWEQLACQPPWQNSADAALVFAVTRGKRPPLPEPPTEEPQLHPDLLDQPASLEVLPQLNAVVRACWRQRELKRPTATGVLIELNNLLTRLGAPRTAMAISPDHVALSLFPTLSGAPSSIIEASINNPAQHPLRN